MIDSADHGKIKVHLIDFGQAEKMNETPQTPDLNDRQKTNGNMLFSSLNQLDSKQTHRIDDIISLFYLIAYYLNDGMVS